MSATDPRTDVVCLGESMVTFVPLQPGRLADVPSFARVVGGAESNVACALAGSGHSARWVSRVGADGFGDHLVETIAARGVDVSAVARDRDRPTGVYFRTDGERPTALGGEGGHRGAGPGGEGGRRGVAEVVYYRAGSAASAMSPESVLSPETAAAVVEDARVLHLTGITAALSPSCLALTRALTAPRPARPLVSFDVNHRVGLWRSAPEPPSVLLELARGCDLVFVGEDEAEAAWGTSDGPSALRALLPEPHVLVVKQGARGATVFVDGVPPVSVPAPAVEVVDPVGAGDAFAAGFLSATLRGLPVRDRLRHGHLLAAAALTVPGDLADPPPRRLADRLADLDDQAWGRLRLCPGWNSQKASTS